MTSLARVAASPVESSALAFCQAHPVDSFALQPRQKPFGEVLGEQLVRPLINTLSRMCPRFPAAPPSLPVTLVPRSPSELFGARFASEIKQHRAAQHPIFARVAELALNGGLDAETFNAFRLMMFRRIHLTVDCLRMLLEFARRVGDKELEAMTLLNLFEEGGRGDAKRMHTVLAEQAFNAVAEEVFGLPPITLREAYDLEDLTTEELEWREIALGLYTDWPQFANLAQETFSGVDGKGMMADLFTIFQALRGRMSSDANWVTKVLPYFAEHLPLDEQGTFLPNKKCGTECEHGQRARSVVEPYLKTFKSVDHAFVVMHLLGDTQAKLFDAWMESNLGVKPPRCFK